jgi:uncharacterized membrane protein YjfL (UPF0719 family)
LNTKLFFLALLELSLSLVIGVFILYVSYLVISRFIQSRFHIEQNNVAYAVLTAAILFSVGLIISGTIQPILSAVRVLNDTQAPTLTIALEVVQYVLLFLVISMVVALVTNLSGLYLFMSLTKVDEFEEIRKNNLAVGIISGTIVVIVAIFVRDSVGLLLESIIPYPKLPISPIR